jgi:hypothetical protein
VPAQFSTHSPLLNQPLRALLLSYTDLTLPSHNVTYSSKTSVQGLPRPYDVLTIPVFYNDVIAAGDDSYTLNGIKALSQKQLKGTLLALYVPLSRFVRVWRCMYGMRTHCRLRLRGVGYICDGTFTHTCDRMRRPPAISVVLLCLVSMGTALVCVSQRIHSCGPRSALSNVLVSTLAWDMVLLTGTGTG